MRIRYGNANDARLLSEFGARTFYETFARDNTPENIALYLRDSFSPEIQFREISERQNIFLIIETESSAAGYAQLVIDSRDESIKGAKPLEIKRIYVSQQYIGKGVGKVLMSACMQEASQLGCDCIWLGVWEKNQRAIDFYRKWGFREVGTHIFMLGDDPQMDFVMELKLI